jgi:cell fate (sporulation/competence/biofilm development) regulator YmcA (YheA/YmcA/DUF963 family)
MWLTKTLPAGLLLCLTQFGPVAAQTPPSVPPLYSREEIDPKIEAIQNEINALRAVDPYSRADIDAKLEGIRSDLKSLQAVNPYSKSETDTKIDAKLEGIRSDLKSLQAVNPYSKSETDTKVDGLEKTLTGKISALGQKEDNNVKALEKVNAIPFWLPIAVSIFAALLAAFALWRTSANRKPDRALAAKNRDASTLAAKPVKRSSVQYRWFGVS